LQREHELGIDQARPVFTGCGNPALTEQEKENQQLRRELEIARQERDILKKALAFLTIRRTFGHGRFFAKETR
jgi:transposase